MQVILLRNFLTLKERELNFVKEKQLKFEQVSSVSIFKILKEFKTNKATMVDNLGGRFLNPLSKMLPSYKNQFIDLHNKSIDWFLYEGNTGT